MLLIELQMRVFRGPASALPGALKLNVLLLLGSVESCDAEMGQSSDDGAAEADSEDNVESCEDGNEDAAEPSAGTNSGWADAMAKILNKKTPKSKPTILTKNKELEKEKEKLKQERLEKRKQVCPPACLCWLWSLSQKHSALRAS